MSLREEQCNKVCRILDDVLANRPTERDSLILAVRKAFAEPHSINLNQGQSSDMISRQAAIDAMTEQAKEMESWSERYAEQRKGILTAINIVSDVSPAEPQERRGKWILDRSGAYCCSKCMEPCATYVMMRPRDKFCKMCGARMEVDNGS